MIIVRGVPFLLPASKMMGTAQLPGKKKEHLFRKIKFTNVFISMIFIQFQPLIIQISTSVVRCPSCSLTSQYTCRCCVWNHVRTYYTVLHWKMCMVYGVIFINSTTLNSNLAIKSFYHVTFTQKLAFLFLVYLSAIWTVNQYLSIIYCVEIYLTTRILFLIAWCYTTIGTKTFRWYVYFRMCRK